MTCKVIVQKNTFLESLTIVGRAVNPHAHLPILGNILLCKNADQLQLSATNLTLGISVWMDARMEGEPGLTLPARTLTDVVNALVEPEIEFSANGKPEAALKCGKYKGVVKGEEASGFPVMAEYDVSSGISVDANAFKEMSQRVVFAASLDDTRPVLTGVQMTIEGQTLSMVATDGFRLALGEMELVGTYPKQQMLIPASSLKEVLRILGATRPGRIILFRPAVGNQVVLRCENIQMVSQLMDEKFPDYRAILPKSHKTRTVLATADLLKACKQASIIARDGSNIVYFYLTPPPAEQPEAKGRVRLKAEADQTGASEIELEALIEGQELKIAFNVKFLQDGLESISTKNVVIETNAHNTPAIIRSTGEEENLYVLMPMHMEE